MSASSDRRVAVIWTSHRGGMQRQLTVALVAHDQCKDDLLDWATSNRHTLAGFHLVATGTTGHLLGDALGLPVARVRSGPLGGDLQLGASIVEGRIDMLIFFWDPLTAQPHEPDVKALLRIAVLRDIPTACNRTTADHLLASHHLLFAAGPGAGSVASADQRRDVRVGAGSPVRLDVGWLAGADTC
jgi:methylglyoxal synthase